MAVAGQIEGTNISPTTSEGKLGCDLGDAVHDEVTHPGDIHEELEVAERNYRFLIGKGGSEMRHIQNSFKVKVCIPREHSFLRNVAIVGKKDNVERAKAYIEKSLYYATAPSKGRDGRNDDYEDDEPEEDWMKSYIYKR